MSTSGNIIASLLADTSRTSLVRESVLEPAAGAGTPVAPAVYDKTTNATFTNAPRPLETAGFHTAVDPAQRVDGVTLSSVFAESTRMEVALWENILFRGDVDATPALVLNMLPELAEAGVKKALAAALKSEKSAPKEMIEALAEDAHVRLLNTGQRHSTWTLAHRHVDAAIRYSNHLDGDPVWKVGNPLHRTLTSAEPADLLKVSPLSLTGGYWLSHGDTVPTRRARIVNANITGYGTSAVTLHTTKSGSSPAAGDLKVKNNLDGTFTVGEGALRPSQLGFGSVPASGVTHYICDLILGRTSVSLTALRNTRIKGDAEGTAIMQKYLLSLVILGRQLADEDTYLRSAADLTPVAETWGVRVRGAGAAEIVGDGDPFHDIQEVSDQLRDQLTERGLISGATHLAFSQDYAEMAALSMIKSGAASEKKKEKEGSGAND